MGLAAIFLMHASPQGLGGIEMIEPDYEAEDSTGYEELLDELHDLEGELNKALEIMHEQRRAGHFGNQRYWGSQELLFLIRHGKIKDPKEGRDE